MKLASAKQMRDLDNEAIQRRGIPSIDLMERAAEGVAEAALALLPVRPGKARAAVLCGAGNNGGDGIAAGRLLFLRGVPVRVFLASSYDRLTPDALEETGRLSECGIPLEEFDPEDREQASWIRACHVIVDALFGVGLSREIAPGSLFAAAIDQINASRAKVVSADIPSGVETDTGRILGRAVRADKTVTFTLPKPGLAAGDGALFAGQV